MVLRNFKIISNFYQVFYFLFGILILVYLCIIRIIKINIYSLHTFRYKGIL